MKTNKRGGRREYNRKAHPWRVPLGKARTAAERAIGDYTGESYARNVNNRRLKKRRCSKPGKQT